MALAHGQTVVRTIELGGLQSHVMLSGYHGEFPSATFRHPNVAQSADTALPLASLNELVAVPAKQGVRCIARYHNWRPITSFPMSRRVEPQTWVAATGSKAWQPYASIIVWPWRNVGAVLEVADSVTIQVICDSAGTVPQPVVVRSREWYVPEAPYVRIHTTNAGIGALRFKQVTDVEPAFAGSAVADLALFWKGTEQPIIVVGRAETDVVQASDTIMFMARFAQGDTSYLSAEDTTAVMFLTKRTNGDRQRLAYSDGLASTTTLNTVAIHERYELDTGYYHLGNATDVEYSDFNSDLAFLEGFYWESLNTNAYERVTWKFPLTPSPGGKVKVTTHYAGSTDIPKFNPDTRLDVSVNGSIPVANITDGYGAYTVENVAPANQTPSGMQTIKWYATGIDSLRGNRDYFSELLIDAVEVTADVLPVLEDGRARVQVPTRSGTTNISWFNTSSNGWWLDTTSHTIGRLTALRRASLIRAGLAPTERDWATIPNDPLSWRITSAFGNVFANIDTVNGWALISFLPRNTLPAIEVFNTEEGLVQRLAVIPSRTHVAVYSTEKAASASLKNTLASRSLPVPTTQSWVIAGIVDIGGEVYGADMRVASGVTYIRDHNDGAQYAADTHIPAGPASTIYVADSTAVEWARVYPAAFANLTANTAQADLLIVTHAVHRAQAERLAEHRRTHSGLTVKVIDVAAILEEFGNGFHEVEAIRSYLAWHYANAQLPRMQACILFGNASWDVRLAVKGGNVRAVRADQVPTYGRPSSDYYLGLLDDPADKAFPEIIVGRLPALTPQEGEAIVDKIIYADTVSYQPWMRTWFFVAGGNETEGLCDIYQDMLDDKFETGITYIDPPLCMDTVTLCKSTAPPNAGFYIKQQIDAGTQWMNYIGHGATEVFDINGWEPSELRNAGKYGMLATYACQTGAYSNPSVACKNAQYLVEPNKGMMATVGASGWQHIWAVNLLHVRLHEVQRNGERFLGDIVYKAKTPIVSENQQSTINTVMQYNLLGDPFSRLYVDTVPSLRILPSNIQVVVPNGSNQITDRDSSVRIKVWVTSMGTGTKEPLTVRLVRTFLHTSDSVETTLSEGICQGAWVWFTIPVIDMAGDHQVRVTVDPNGYIDRTAADNTATSTFTVLPQSLLGIEPVPFEQLSSNTVHVRLVDPLGLDLQGQVHLVVSKQASLQMDSIVTEAQPNEILRDGSILDWQVTLSQIATPTRLYIGAWTTTETDTSAILWIPFEVLVHNGARNHCDAVDMTPVADKLEYSVADQGWTLRKLSRKAFLRSSGKQMSNAQEMPPLEMAIGDVMYVRNEYFRGVNVIVVGQFDTLPRAIRRYDTWQFPTPKETGHNGYTSDAIRFLRDSVAANEQVLLAVCNESFSGFVNDGNLDSFRLVLKGYGSAYADSLWLNSSWAMIGKQGSAIGSVPEAWKGAPDSMVTVSDTLTFFEEEGTLASNLVGPGVLWDSVEVSFDSAGTTCLLLARNHDGTLAVIDTLTPGVTELHDRIDTAVPTHLALLFSQQRLSNEPASYIRGARFYYQPAHELLLESNALDLTPNDVLRADSVTATVTVRNADRRFAVRNVGVSLLHDSVPSAGADPAVMIPFLAPDATVRMSVAFGTTLLPQTGAVRAWVDKAGSITEFYQFNNQASQPLYVREDSVSPTIAMYADSAAVHNGSYVAPRPYLDVRISDNSRLPITDETKLLVFVNGVRIKSEVVDGYKFLSTDSCLAAGYDSSVRASMQFYFVMDVGQNNVLVRASDATGNKAELELSVYLATESAITTGIVYPNPTQGITEFAIVTQMPNPSSLARLSIVDLQGRVVYTNQTTVPNGRSTLVWDGMSDQGTSVSSGAYLWRIELADMQGGWGAGTTGVLQMLR